MTCSGIKCRDIGFVYIFIFFLSPFFLTFYMYKNRWKTFTYDFDEVIAALIQSDSVEETSKVREKKKKKNNANDI